MKIMKTAVKLLSLYTLFIILILLAWGVSASLESLDFAKTIPSGIYTGTLTKEDETDYYKFYAAEGSIVEIKVYAYKQDVKNRELPSLMRGVVSLIDYQTRRNLFSETFTSNQSGSSHIAVPGSGYYVIEIHRSMYEGSYTMNLNIESPNDGNTGKDAPDSTEKALEIENGIYTGMLAEGDELDYYKVKLRSGERIEVKFRPKTLFRINEMIMIGDYIDPTITATTNGEEIKVINAVGNVEFTQWGYIRFSREQGEGEYSFTVNVTQQNDANLQNDAYDDINKAKEINFGRYNGFLGGMDRKDNYWFYPQPNEPIQINVNPSIDLSARLKLYNARSGESILYEEGKKGELRTISFVAQDDAYVITIEAYEGGGNYEFSIGPPQVQHQSMQNQSSNQSLINTGQQPIQNPSTAQQSQQTTQTPQKKSYWLLIVLCVLAFVILVALLIWIVRILRRY